MPTKISLKSFTGKGRSGDERGKSNLGDKANVNEEYREAFRTQSYIEMWGKIQGQLSTTFSSSPLSSPYNLYMDHLAETLMDPPHQALLDMLRRYDPDPLLMDYFDASLQACNLCESLLRSVHQTRAGDRIIRRVIKLSQRLQDVKGRSGAEERYCRAILGELARFAMLKNPLSEITPANFRDIHDGNTALLRGITSKRKKIRRRAKLSRWCKKVGGMGLVVSHSAVMVAFLVLAIHSMVGMVAVPGMVACGVEMMRKRGPLGKMGAGPERLCAQLDVAAKGVYILVNDLDTMSRLARRLHDEVEHRRTVAGMCARSVSGNAEVLREVVREFGVHESGFLEQLEELERHIHLCLLTINRSRRLLARQVLAGH